MDAKNDDQQRKSLSGADPDRREQRRQFGVAVAILGGVLLLVVGMMLGWRWLPGFLGDYFRGIAGVVTTPFLLEAIFIILGLVIVIVLNNWRAQREGDEFVDLDQIAEPEVAADGPLAARAEAAVGRGDFTAAADLLERMSEAELRQSQALRVRLELARVHGDEERVKCLEREIHGTDGPGGCV